MASVEREVDGPQWRKARRSANNGACVEVAPVGGQILIRDSKDPNGPILRCPGHSWRMFTENEKAVPLRSE
jgi:Domain of unknown function (DUF397)